MCRVWKKTQQYDIILSRNVYKLGVFFVWWLWPSRINNTGFLGRGLKCSINFLNQKRNVFLLIQPRSWNTANDPGGAWSIKRGFSVFRGNINIDGMKFYVVLKQISAVTSTPLSADVNLPNCFLPRKARTLDALLSRYSSSQRFRYHWVRSYISSIMFLVNQRKICLWRDWRFLCALLCFLQVT